MISVETQCNINNEIKRLLASSLMGLNIQKENVHVNGGKYYNLFIYLKHTIIYYINIICIIIESTYVFYWLLVELYSVVWKIFPLYSWLVQHVHHYLYPYHGYSCCVYCTLRVKTGRLLTLITLFSLSWIIIKHYY